MSKKTVLLLGAGVTRAASPNRTLGKTPPLDADFFRIAERAYPAETEQVRNALRTLLGMYAETLTESLETATTYLYLKALDSKARSKQYKTFLQLLDLINRVLATSTNDNRIGPRSLIYRFLLGELNKVDSPEHLTIITFNYDLLIERTLASIRDHGRPDVFSYPGCYRLDGVQITPGVRNSPTFGTPEFQPYGVAVLKLHGSLSWRSSHSSNTPPPRALFNTARKLVVVNSRLISPVLYWRPNKRKVYMKPIVVPPVSGKRGVIQNDIVPLWSLAADALKAANRVVIAGYSCPPLDLEARFLLSENLRANHNKKLYVIDPKPTVAAQFLELCGVDHLTMYTSIESWTRDDPIRN